MAGRKPYPTHLKIVKGTARADRINPKEAKISSNYGMPQPPSFLTREARQEWDEQIKILFKIGLVTKIDRTALAAYCQAYGRWRRAEEVLAEEMAKDEIENGFTITTKQGNKIHNPLVSIANTAMSDSIKYAAHLGLTPSSRSRISAEPISDDDPASKYLD